MVDFLQKVGLAVRKKDANFGCHANGEESDYFHLGDGFCVGHYD